MLKAVQFLSKLASDIKYYVKREYLIDDVKAYYIEHPDIQLSLWGPVYRLTVLGSDPGTLEICFYGFSYAWKTGFNITVKLDRMQPLEYNKRLVKFKAWEILQQETRRYLMERSE